MRARNAFAELYRRGVLATLPALLVSSLFSFVFNRPWALEPITERVMQLTPVDLSQQLLLHLGTYARPLALFGGLAILIAVGGVVSSAAGNLQFTLLPARQRVERRVSPAAHARPLVALGLLLLTLFVVFPPLDPAPTALFAGCYVAALLSSAIVCARRSTRDGSDGAGPVVRSGVEMRRRRGSPGRRAFVVDSACLLGAAALLTGLLLVEPWYKSLTVYRRGGRLFAFRPTPPRRPGFDLAGLTPEVTSPGNFYYMSKNLVDPDLAADDWTLRLDGLVARPRLLTFDDVLALPARSQWVTQECVSNPVGGPLISCALFTGVSLRRLLLAAGPLPRASQVVMRAPDGHTDSIPLGRALEPDVLVAYGMDGAYLDRAHGYPARILIPGSYGLKSVKWVTQIEVVDHAYRGTWQELGWSAAAIVHTTTRIDLARRVPSGLLVAGVAFAGRRGVRAVQVRVGHGAWNTAQLHTPPLSPLTWVQWRLVVPLAVSSPATVAVEARAIDGTGAMQDARRSDIYPAGATGYHQVNVSV